MTDESSSAADASGAVPLSVTWSGPVGGPPVLLLHGFPEGSACWRRQVGPLADAGYRVGVPDQRGYGTSGKPPGIDAYGLDRLAADVLGLIEASGRSRVALVGHDWGGIVAWWVALTHPDRVGRLAVLNAPHPVAFRRHIRTSPRQLLRSWYVLVFQLPRLPEALLRWRNWWALARMLRVSSRPGTFSAADLDAYRRSWSTPGSITAMIHWYRAALRRPPAQPVEERVRVPTLLLWGTRDTFLGRELAEASLASCEAGRLAFFEEATHWVQHEEPDRVNRLLIDFLGAGDPPPASTP